MSAKWIQLSVLTGLLAVVAPLCVAHDLSAAIATCRAEKNDALRLACYDREVDRPVQHVSGTAAAPAAAMQAASTPAAAPQSPEDRFGYRGVLAREESDRNKQEARNLSELAAIVTDVSKRGDGTLLMTLDNGQVWAQIRPDATFRLKVGDRIRIEPASLGSYLMIGPAKRTARVTRIK